MPAGPISSALSSPVPAGVSGTAGSATTFAVISAVIPGMVGALMLRLYGSDDLFPDNPRDACRPFETVNYVTCHDGFTLYDSVAYNEKWNWPNGHGNTDGTSNNLSWNCGWEGDEAVPAEVMALRKRQAKNLFCLLLLANGVPMFGAGDEFLKTQRGNNNPYNQDNETTWLDWSRQELHSDHFRFAKQHDRIP